MDVFKNKQKLGFTLIELLVVISVIGLLSSVVLASLSGARESGREAAAKTELNSLRVGVELLINDTGAGPAGCRGGTEGNHAYPLDRQVAGLTEKPEVGQGPGSHGTPCAWSQSEVDGWDGPYVQVDELTDPWGDPYYFDTSWVFYDADVCPDYRTNIQGALYSRAGTDEVGEDANGDECDDIWVSLE